MLMPKKGKPNVVHRLSVVDPIHATARKVPSIVQNRAGSRKDGLCLLLNRRVDGGETAFR
jgi:hypothetical protein